MDMEVKKPKLFSEADIARFWRMCLEDLDEQYVNVNLDDDDFSRAEHHHQAEAINITLVDNFESGFAETDVFNFFERFDIADDDTTVNITPDEHPQVPSTLVPLPPMQEDPHQRKEQYYAAPSPIQEEPQQGRSSQKQEEQKMKGQQPTKPSKGKACGKVEQVIMDNDQIIIPGNIYQTWLKDPSSLISKRHKVSSKVNLIQSMSIDDLMDMPPVALISNLDKSPSEFYYPKQLMQLWKECTEVRSTKASSSGGQPSSSQEQQQKLAASGISTSAYQRHRRAGAITAPPKPRGPGPRPPVNHSYPLRSLSPHNSQPQGEYQRADDIEKLGGNMSETIMVPPNRTDPGPRPPVRHNYPLRSLARHKLHPQREYQRRDDAEKLGGNMSAEHERAYEDLQSDHSVTPGSPGPRGGSIQLEEAWRTLIQLKKNCKQGGTPQDRKAFRYWANP